MDRQALMGSYYPIRRFDEIPPTARSLFALAAEGKPPPSTKRTRVNVSYLVSLNGVSLGYNATRVKREPRICAGRRRVRRRVSPPRTVLGMSGMERKAACPL